MDRAGSAHLLLLLLYCTQVMSNPIVDCNKAKRVLDLSAELNVKAQELLTSFLLLQGPPFNTNNSQLCQVPLDGLPEKLRHSEDHEALSKICAAIDIFNQQLGNILEHQGQVCPRIKSLNCDVTANLNLLTSLRTQIAHAYAHAHAHARATSPGNRGSFPKVLKRKHSESKFQEKMKNCTILQAFKSYTEEMLAHFSHSYAKHCH